MVELPPGAVIFLSLIRNLPAKAKELRVIATNLQLTPKPAPTFRRCGFKSRSATTISDFRFQISDLIKSQI
ncbi:MAG TPA: hypothetical protein DCY88_30910 [Cyanobacteria bacterium UBA11372]|nr:hypothetical protein [Cyanobacteria bacterium UBA11372]